ncbi:hypothetical protein GJAV_G00106380 [Gymnothorax javanicus]|nr:hypothetical protein GJAV_G00106380 [Gymnothorax javanicus]
MRAVLWQGSANHSALTSPSPQVRDLRAGPKAQIVSEVQKFEANTHRCLCKTSQRTRANMIRGILSAFLVLAAFSTSLAKQEKQEKKEKRIPQTLSRGWGDQLIWAQTYEEALYKAKVSNKPLMVIFHLEHCPHSLALKKEFANSKEIQRMADEEFIILNLVYETTDKHLSPDGQYVPRVIFVDPSMTVRADIIGPYSNRMYTYEPSDIETLLKNMIKAKQLLKSEL